MRGCIALAESECRARGFVPSSPDESPRRPLCAPPYRGGTTQDQRNADARAAFIAELGPSFPDETDPRVAAVLREVPAAMSGWARRLWWTSWCDLIGARPVDLLERRPEAVVAAARAEAAEWAQAAATNPLP